VVLDDGTLGHEGNLWEHVSPDHTRFLTAPLSKEKGLQKLLVPLCMSASHIAYSSIRMEATYMVMGESAGIATLLQSATIKRFRTSIAPDESV
jgi:hypothetical protein